MLNIDKISQAVLSKPSLGIVIVNWNTGELLKSCLNSLLKCKDNSYTLDKIIIVDNNSTDRSHKNIPDNMNTIKLIQNSDNLGFGKACNQGAQFLETDYILFLNPDTECSELSLDSAISFMNMPTNNNIGICGTALYSENNAFSSSCSRFPYPLFYLYEAIGLTRILPSICKPLLLSENECISSNYVDQVIGAFFLVRKSLFKRLDGFDEQFFVYFEEVDFSYRAKELGYHSYFLSNIYNYHLGGGSSSSVIGKRLFYSLSSRLKYAKKHFSISKYMFIFMVTFLLESFSRVLYALIRLNKAEITGVFQGYRLLIISFVNFK